MFPTSPKRSFSAVVIFCILIAEPRSQERALHELYKWTFLCWSKIYRAMSAEKEIKPTSNGNDPNQNWRFELSSLEVSIECCRVSLQMTQQYAGRSSWLVCAKCRWKYDAAQNPRCCGATSHSSASSSSNLVPSSGDSMRHVDCNAYKKI